MYNDQIDHVLHMNEVKRKASQANTKLTESRLRSGFQSPRTVPIASFGELGLGKRNPQHQKTNRLHTSLFSSMWCVRGVFTLHTAYSRHA